MTSFNFLERIIWLHARIKADAYPDADDLALEFELSQRTAQRTIANLRDRLGAPIAYHRIRKGYYYTDKDYRLPLARVSQEEILAVLLVRSLLEKSAGGYISRAIEKFSRRLMTMTSFLGLGDEVMDKAFSAVWNLYSPAQALVFKTVFQSLLDSRTLTFDYTPPATGLTLFRKVEPHHLQHYMGSWVLIAFCLERKDWRKFYLSRMDRVEQTRESFQPRPIEQWSFQLESSFGIFQGRESRPVVLRFNPFRARWIREQIWHPDQKMRDLEDGSLELEIPVADFREIKLRILSFGADVEVISPEELKQEVAAEIQKMTRIYKK